MTNYKLTQNTIRVIKEPTAHEITTQIKSSETAANLFRELYSIVNEDVGVRECFFALYLNRANKVISFSLISAGGISATFVDPKIIFKAAIDNLANSIILCHNHPSGTLYPSTEDLDITKKIKGACDFFDMRLLDHIILTDNNYYSFADNGDI